MDVKGVAAVVTGAASGLGEATARELARRGAKVAVFDRDMSGASRSRREIGGIFCEVDVTSDEKVAAAFDKGARGARPGAHPRQLRGRRQRRENGRRATRRPRPRSSIRCSSSSWRFRST